MAANLSALSHSYDVVVHILQWLSGDYLALYRCSLVNRLFKDAAATFLYQNVTYSPKFNPGLDLRRRPESVLMQGFFASARLPHNAVFVRRLEISGFLSSRPLPLNKFSSELNAALTCWPNIHTMVLYPSEYHGSVFADTLPLLLGFTQLRHLSVNASCTEEAHVRTLVQLRNLHTLTIQSPSRAILQVLPEWLHELRPTLRKLRLTHNCGSVTPGVLRSFIPALQDTTTIGLGLSYALMDDDVFTFWEQLPALDTIEHRYYLQLRPSIRPHLPTLRRLTVHYQRVTTRADAGHLYKWVRRVVAHASHLEVLRLECQSRPVYPEATPSFDSLLEHLAAKHASALRVLVMPECFVGRKALTRLCERCVRLEELSVSVALDDLHKLAEGGTALNRLRSIHFRLVKTKRSEVSPEVPLKLIRDDNSVGSLDLNGKRYQRKYLRKEDGSIDLVVEREDNTPHVLTG